MKLKNLHLTLDEDDYKKLLKAKGNRTWYDFIMSLANEDDE